MRTSNAAAPGIPASDAGTSIGLVAVVLWSASVGLMRSIAELLGPTGGAATIFSVAALLSFLALGVPRLASFDKVYLFAGGLLFIAYEILLALSLGLAADRAQALELGMINYMWPCLTILFAVAARQQAGSWVLVPGAALTFGGLAWVMKGEAPWSAQASLAHVSGNPLPYGLAACAAVIWAAYSVLTRRFGAGKSGVPLFLAGTAAILWLMHAASPEPPLRLTWAAATQAGVLGAFVAMAYSCWNHGIQHGNMTLLAVASYFTPVLSVLLASAWLKTAPGASFWTGVALVTLGSIVCWWSTRPTARYAQPPR
jgi:drug/metabolite transporter (DMT)-like permease